MIEYKGYDGIPVNKKPNNSTENDMSGWRTKTPKIDYYKCVSCKKCYVFCPDVAISWEEDESFPVIDYKLCKGCGICAQECPVNAITEE